MVALTYTPFLQFDLLFSLYGRLRCELIPVEVDSEEFSMVELWYQNLLIVLRIYDVVSYAFMYNVQPLL